ncbi:oligopeptide/dipeptide ABC transporter, ATPase subunit [Thermoanaerobacter italicus Ab9]|uniref:Oligopeptide/dipeptide ABC transporter, ATPase subunit n=1 Tax=Thermoanaerobacter italicus (strain DSM 9252 / Ab9) TaxID=580331 RepID=D3T6L9_THEIA|nr:oligopeptide/dipeptide ABC transporter, ATPase subunit [Thermoanaerobacter italicus Ab9]
MIQIEGLQIYYKTLHGDAKALDDVTFTINDKEILGIAGESGCGKSTLGNSLILLKPPMKYVSGDVKVNGEKLPIDNNNEMRKYRYKKISLIPQYAMDALNPTRKIKGIIKDLVEEHRIKYEEIEKRLHERLNMVKLSKDVLNMYPFELSGGMKQRLVLVISTLLNPDLLIADEVTSALDVSSQKAVSLMFKEFRDREIVNSIIFITHDIAVLYQIADRIVIMYAGKVAEIGLTEEIIANPLHPYTKALIKSLPNAGVRHTKERLEGIPGHPPDLLDPPAGCRFKDRCPIADESCLKEPPLQEINKGRFVACWKVKDL